VAPKARRDDDVPLCSARPSSRVVGRAFLQSGFVRLASASRRVQPASRSAFSSPLLKTCFSRPASRDLLIEARLSRPASRGLLPEVCLWRSASGGLLPRVCFRRAASSGQRLQARSFYPLSRSACSIPLVQTALGAMARVQTPGDNECEGRQGEDDDERGAIHGEVSGDGDRSVRGRPERSILEPTALAGSAAATSASPQAGGPARRTMAPDRSDRQSGNISSRQPPCGAALSPRPRRPRRRWAPSRRRRRRAGRRAV